MLIEHLGKTFDTKHYIKISKEECDTIRQEYFKKPSLESVEKEITNIINGKVKISNITKYYFFDLIAEAKLYSSKWSIREFFECDDLIRFTYGKVKNNPNFYKHPNLITNIATVMRLSPSGTAAKISNYPIKSVKQIIQKYSTNDNYYDFSCGWGVRMLGAFSENINYFGTDPNFKLTEQLDLLGKKYKTFKHVNYDIRTQGSEKFIPEWENTMGLVFSSPPYYDVEDYKFGEQSIKDRNYKQWLEEYWRTTVKNIIKYMTTDANMLLNIKNYKNYQLLDDMKAICIEEGLIYKESVELKNINRVILSQNNKHTNEEILVFTKI